MVLMHYEYIVTWWRCDNETGDIPVHDEAVGIVHVDKFNALSPTFQAVLKRRIVGPWEAITHLESEA
jgi:hypothetical protein